MDGWVEERSGGLVNKWWMEGGVSGQMGGWREVCVLDIERHLGF
jgi:hypothetical protein